MSTSEETAPAPAAPPSAPPEDSGADAAVADGAVADVAVADVAAVEPDAARETADSLSPAVRRLVRQYDLDVTAIHGTGPDGRIRVGDVIGMLGPRAEQAVRGVTTPRAAPVETAADVEDAVAEPEPDAPATAAPALATPSALVTTVFECDLGRVLAHRKRLKAENVELLVTSYFLAAIVEALAVAPEIAGREVPCIGVDLATADGSAWRLKVDSAGVAAEPLAERVRTVDAALRRSVGADLSATDLLVHHYGASGSLLATPTPLAAGHAASVGVGRVRRQIVLRNVDGDETPRVTACCHVSLSFLPDFVTLQRANQFMSQAVRLLEQWPE
jgi:pyruvate/2-oxoglutarate dehydrogenase complex dihydrolipoamide acyltransferase (E2) component